MKQYFKQLCTSLKIIMGALIYAICDSLVEWHVDAMNRNSRYFDTEICKWLYKYHLKVADMASNGCTYWRDVVKRNIKLKKSLV